MVSLPKPSRDVALRVMGEVGFEERLLGVKMRPMVGNQEHFVYSVKEVIEFLRMDSVEDLLTTGSKAYVGYIDPLVLKKWMVEVIGDKVLAETGIIRIAGVRVAGSHTIDKNVIGVCRQVDADAGRQDIVGVTFCNNVAAGIEDLDEDVKVGGQVSRFGVDDSFTCCSLEREDIHIVGSFNDAGSDQILAGEYGGAVQPIAMVIRSIAGAIG